MYDFYYCFASGMIKVFILCLYCTNAHVLISKDTKHIYEPVHEISNNLVCATSKASDQPAHTRSLIRAFASRLSILYMLSY